MLNYKLFLAIIFSASMFSCGGNADEEQQDEELVEADSTIDETESGSEYTDEFADLPENIENLRNVFSNYDLESQLDSTHVEIIHEDWQNAPITPFIAHKLSKMDDGWVFVYSTKQGVTAWYELNLYGIAFFDNAGEYVNSVSQLCYNEDVKISVISNKFVGIINHYDEFEEIDAEDGVDLIETDKTESNYFICHFDEIEHLIDDTDSADWPYWRNWVYAYHGYIFKNEDYTEYYKLFDWYNPQFDNVDDLTNLITPDEKDFAEYMQQQENSVE